MASLLSLYLSYTDSMNFTRCIAWKLLFLCSLSFAAQPDSSPKGICAHLLSTLSAGNPQPVLKFLESRDVLIPVSGTGLTVEQLLEKVTPFVEAGASFIVYDKNHLEYPRHIDGAKISTSMDGVRIEGRFFPWGKVDSLEIVDFGDHLKNLRETQKRQEDAATSNFVKGIGPRPDRIVTSRYDSKDQVRIFQKLVGENLTFFLDSSRGPLMLGRNKITGRIESVDSATGTISVTYTSGLDGEVTQKFRFSAITSVQ